MRAGQAAGADDVLDVRLDEKVFIDGDVKISDTSLSKGIGIYAVKNSSILFSGGTMYFYNCSIGVKVSSMSRCHFESGHVDGTNNTSFLYAESGGIAGLGGENFAAIVYGSFTEFTKTSNSGIYIPEVWE